MRINSSADEIGIYLNKNEALVFFEFLSRYSDSDKMDIEDQAEQRILWNLTCLLESDLAEPFAENYGDLLEAARSEIRDKE